MHGLRCIIEFLQMRNNFKISWPDFTLPPINLWNFPWQNIERTFSNTAIVRPSTPRINPEEKIKEILKHH